ncbi:Major facilitator superfamily transporter [Pleurostoma richardsiae]|uniref:Major facilitator superfamily transporter n=1 Tax=Pleurostoma richardsiae TaxID=41990 RepID=A0AA38R712_9PEZI|nr:Major facilitator superfamily transporter [Pleurostoma richardsiae]
MDAGSSPRAASSAVEETDKELAPPPRESDGEEDDPELGDSGLQAQQSRTDSIWIASTLSFPREAMFVSIVCMSQFCTQAAFNNVLVLMHTIGDGFGITNPGQLSWLVAGYSLTVGTFILFSGRLGDVFGYKRMLLIGFCWFALWSLIAGVSVYKNFVLFVFARVLQGIGPAICLPNGLAILGAAYPPGHRKAMVFSLFGASAPTGAIVGMAISCVISLAWWPWMFWALAITLVLMAAVGYFIIPVPPRKHAPPKDLQELAIELDLPGVVSGVTALILFNFAWNQAPLTGWAAPEVIVTLILGLILIGAFFVIELRYASMPLLPLDAVNSDVAFVLGAVCLGWATFGIWSLYLVQIIQQIRHHSPLLTAAWFAPVAPVGLFAAIVTGVLLGPLKVQPPYVMLMALLAFLIGVILTATAPIHTSYWAPTFIALLIMPFGMDLSFPASTLILSNAVAKKHQGIGASLINTVVNYGISLGVGFAGTVEVHVNNGGKTEADLLKGYRGALYMGTGLAGLGVIVCILYLAKHHFQSGERGDDAPEKTVDSGARTPNVLEESDGA